MPCHSDLRAYVIHTGDAVTLATRYLARCRCCWIQASLIRSFHTCHEAPPVTFYAAIYYAWRECAPLLISMLATEGVAATMLRAEALLFTLAMIRQRAMRETSSSLRDENEDGLSFSALCASSTPGYLIFAPLCFLDVFSSIPRSSAYLMPHVAARSPPDFCRSMLPCYLILLHDTSPRPQRLHASSRFRPLRSAIRRPRRRASVRYMRCHYFAPLRFEYHAIFVIPPRPLPATLSAITRR